MAQHGSHALSSRTRLLTTLIAGCFAGTALALPTGAQIAAGTAAITQAGNVLTVNNSANAILNWQQFNIAASEAVRFNQPSASSSVLNRVLGADPSSLLGQLTSNGRVWLVNPAGILVGPGARIDTAGFVASTLNLRNEDFLAGKLTFGGNAGAGGVVNQGAIATPGGGSVYLIAPNVSNEGLITTPGGETILAAGQTVQLLDTATPGVKVEVTGSTGNVTNLGSVVAEAGRIGMAGVLVKNSGTLNASSVVSAGGRIFLKASGDTYVDKDARISATGSRGGDIEVLGQRVAVMDRAVLDASGQSGGGSVRVGGDYQGKNPEIQNADVTYFGPKATLRADALGKGDGGKVIVWADDTTRAYGSISARGGVSGGDGGFVETSGKQYLVVGGSVDASAPQGKPGQWLLDPNDITIVNGAAGALTNMTEAPFGVFATTNDAAQITNGTITDALNAGTSVSLTTGTAGTDAETGAITINAGAPIVTTTANGNVSLSMTASGALNVYDAITNTGGNQLNVSLTGKNITFTAAGDISAGTGTVNLSSNGAHALTSIVFGTAISGADINIKTDRLSLLGTLNATNAIGVTRKNNDVEVQVGLSAADNVGNGIDIAGFGSVGIDDAELLNITANIYRFGDITSTGGLLVAGNVTIPGTKSLSLLTSNVGGSQIAQNAGATISADYLRLEGGSGVTLTNVSHNVTSLAGKTLSGNFQFKNAGNLNIATIDGQAGIDAGANNVLLTTTAGGISGSSPITAANLGVTAAGTVTLAGANSVNSFSADVSSSTVASGVYFKNIKTLDIGASGIATYLGTGHVGLWLTAGSLTQTGTISAANLVVKSEQGDVTLTGANTVSNVAAKVGTASTYENRNFRFTNSSALNVGTLLTPNADFNTVSGIGIDIAGTFDSGSPGGVIALTSAAGLTQSAGALLGGKAVNANAATVNLQLANPTGVIAGAATGGSFQYKSINPIFVTTVNGALGVQNTGIGGDVVLTSTGGGISQDQPISTKNEAGGGGFGLSLTSAGNVMLQEAGNNFATIAANVSTGSLLVRDSADLAVGIVGGVTGITTNNTSVELATGPGKQLTVNSPINAGAVSGAVALESDLLDFVNTVTANHVDIRPYTADHPITVGATVANTLSVTNLWKVVSPTIGIGSEYAGKKAGAIYVAGITTGSALVTDKLATTTRVGLLSGAGITQGGAISVQDLGISADGVVDLSNAANAVTNLAGKTNGQTFTFVNSPSLNTALLSGGTGPYTYSMNGIATSNGNIALTSGTGDITLYHPISAGSGNVTLDAAGAIIDGNGAANNVSAWALLALATSGIGHGDALETQVRYLEAENKNTGTNNIEVTNTGALDMLSGIRNTLGNIVIDNTGGITTGDGAPHAITAGGNVVLTAHSPLTIGTGGVSALGSVTLTAGSAGSSTAADILTINGNVTAGSTITLAGHATTGTSVPTGGNVTSQIYSAPAAAEPPPPPPPTVAECTSNPALSGCSSILPSLSACTADPTAAGCTAVLPTLATCTTDPTATGCTSVLPTLATCTTNPTAAGCTAVLPSLATCTTNPTAAGCTSVLPTLAACTTTPTAAGCTAVLPTLATCTATPTAAGCTSVLPTLATCTTDPTAAGCTSVLPSLASCTTTPTAAGCTAVLPSLATCTTNPTATGCTVVLPTLASCTATPTAAGCTSVLPSVATCTANPTAAGCTSVLPTLATCTTAPTTAGCAAVLPPLDSCVTNATLEGCAAVLPTLASCSADSTQAGCTTVLPPVVATTTSINEVVTVTAALTNTVTETTPAATPAAPAPTPLTGVTAAAVVLLNTNQTIGGTEGTFGGDSSTGTASSFSTTSASSGLGSADQPTASNTADTPSGDKPAESKDQKDDKKDEVQAKKQEDKPTTKKPPICS